MSKREKLHGVVVFLLLVAAMGVAGWYENHDVVPQPTVTEMMEAVNRSLGPDRAFLVKR
jgi:hypothetical protein